MRRLLSFMLCAFALIVGAKAQACGNCCGDEEAIRQVINNYVKTINDADTALTARIWSHEPNVSFIGPSGRYATYKGIIRDFIIGVWEKNFTTRNLQPEDMKINLEGNMAWVEFSWKFDAIRKDGKPHHTKGLETQVLKKGPDGWKLVHVHYSGR